MNEGRRWWGVSKGKGERKGRYRETERVRKKEKKNSKGKTLTIELPDFFEKRCDRVFYLPADS